MNAKSGSTIGSKTQIKQQQAMTANYAGTRGTYMYSVHVINHKNVINIRSNNVILPVLTCWHTQHEQTIVSDTAHDGQNIILTAKIRQFMYVVYTCLSCLSQSVRYLQYTWSTGPAQVVGSITGLFP